MPDKDELLESLMEDHKDDFEQTETVADDTSNDGGGDSSTDNTEDEVTGTEDNSDDNSDESADTIDSQDEEESEEGGDGSVEFDGSDDTEAEPVGEKKDANSRIRQLLEEKRAIEEKLAEKIAAEEKLRDAQEDPVYKLEDFIGTVGEDGEVLSDREAEARFLAWEADYKLRQYQKAEVAREELQTVVALQNETAEAFTKFPEFNANSGDQYDPRWANIANTAFVAGLIYKPGHEGDNNYIIGSRIKPSELLEELHNLRSEVAPPVTKVNNLGDDTGKIVSSQQVNKREPKYAPGFRGEVDKELDKLMKGIK